MKKGMKSEKIPPNVKVHFCHSVKGKFSMMEPLGRLQEIVQNTLKSNKLL